MKLFILSWFISTLTLIGLDMLWSKFNVKIDRLFNDKYKDW